MFNNTFVYFTVVNMAFLSIKIIYLLNLSVTVKIKLNLFNIINKVKMKFIIIIWKDADKLLINYINLYSL